MDEEDNKPLIIAIILNIALYFNALYWLLLFLILVIISILANYDIIINFPEAAIVGVGLALIFSIINWILKPILLIQTYKYIIRKYPNHCTAKWLQNDIKNKDTKEFIMSVVIILELIWLTFAYLFYKTGHIENPLKYALILYVAFGGGLLWSYIIYLIYNYKFANK